MYILWVHGAYTKYILRLIRNTDVCKNFPSMVAVEKVLRNPKCMQRKTLTGCIISRLISSDCVQRTTDWTNITCITTEKTPGSILSSLLHQTNIFTQNSLTHCKYKQYTEAKKCVSD